MISDKQHERHIDYQKQHFDVDVSHFIQPIPDDIQNRTRRIVRMACLDAQSKVLDVGTGVGVLIHHFFEFGVINSNVVGCDLSTNMLQEARRRFPDVYFWEGDIITFPKDLGPFTAVFFNACFGNIDDQLQVLKHVAAMLTQSGRIIISHPLGKAFVAKLHESDPKLVPHLLPDEPQLVSWACHLNLKLIQYYDEPEFYMAILGLASQYCR